MKISISLVVLVGQFVGSKSWLPKKIFQKSAMVASSALQMSTAATVAEAEIIGAGRIGSLLAEAGNAVVLGRQDTIDPNKSGPILIATRNDALDAIVNNCPQNRRKDLVFMQNGYLDKFL